MRALVPVIAAALADQCVVKQLAKRNGCVQLAAADLGVPGPALRKRLRADPHLWDEAFEIIERRLDKAEDAIIKALYSKEPRRRDLSAIFILKSVQAAKRRGWK